MALMIGCGDAGIGIMGEGEAKGEDTVDEDEGEAKAESEAEHEDEGNGGVEGDLGDCGDGECTADEGCDDCPLDCVCDVCGDNVCAIDYGESADTCAKDCAGFCGDGVCSIADTFDSTEFCFTCPDDCPCGKGDCHDALYELLYCEEDMGCYSDILAETSEDAQVAFTDVYTCWRERCETECLTAGETGCSSCSCDACLKEVESCLEHECDLSQ